MAKTAARNRQSQSELAMHNTSHQLQRRHKNDRRYDTVQDVDTNPYDDLDQGYNLKHIYSPLNDAKNFERSRPATSASAKHINNKSGLALKSNLMKAVVQAEMDKKL